MVCLLGLFVLLNGGNPRLQDRQKPPRGRLCRFGLALLWQDGLAEPHHLFPHPVIHLAQPRLQRLQHRWVPRLARAP